MNEPISNSVWLHCPFCSKDTSHTVRAHYVTTGPPEPASTAPTNRDLPLFVWTALDILECNACGLTGFRRGSTPTPQTPESWVWVLNNGYDQQEISLRAADWLPTAVAKLYLETWKVFHCGALTLAAIGLRAVIEAVCSDRHCKGENLRKRISKLGTVLNQSEINLLQLNRSLGNAAAHSMETPSISELSSALAILEHLLKTLYDLPRLANDLKRSRAVRIRDNS